MPGAIELKKPVTKSTIFNKKLVSKKGRAVTGQPKELRESQDYPPAFGRAIAKLYRKHEARIKQVAHVNQINDFKDIAINDLVCKYPDDLWEDACMPEVYDWLAIQGCDKPGVVAAAMDVA